MGFDAIEINLVRWICDEKVVRGETPSNSPNGSLTCPNDFYLCDQSVNLILSRAEMSAEMEGFTVRKKLRTSVSSSMEKDLSRVE